MEATHHELPLFRAHRGKGRFGHLVKMMALALLLVLAFFMAIVQFLWLMELDEWIFAS